MKRIFIFWAFASIIFFNVHAVTIQHVTLKNGSILNGYIQQAKGGVLTFHSNNAMIIVDKAEADITDQPILISRLDSIWIQWADKNDAFDGLGDTRTLTLSTIIFRDEPGKANKSATEDSVTKKQSKQNFAYYLAQKRTISNIRIIERGARLCYLEKSSNLYTFTWADVASIRIDKRPKSALSGINCIYELRNGKTYEGQAAGETETSLSLYINNAVQSFPIDDVIKYTYKGINASQDILQQSELLDVVRKKNGVNVRGVIIEQNYSSVNDEDNYILIKDENNAIQSIRISEISETLKEINPDYKPLNDVILQVGDVLVNRKNMRSVKVSERDYVLTLDSICQTNIIQIGGEPSTNITVEYRTADSQNIELFRLVKVIATEVKRKHVFSFSYKDLSESAIRPTSVNTSVNQTTRADYSVQSTPAIYALYNDKTRTAIPLLIKKIK